MQEAFLNLEHVDESPMSNASAIVGEEIKRMADIIEREEEEEVKGEVVSEIGGAEQEMQHTNAEEETK